MEAVVITTPETTAVAPAADPAQVADRPAWLPEKFASAEDMAKAYTALETKQSAAPTEDPKTPTVETAGLDLNAMAQEYIDNGNKLKPESVETLKAKGLTPEAFDTFVAGLKAGADATVAALASTVGGKPQLDTLYAWAKANVPTNELEAYNAIITAGNLNASKLALEGLLGRYVKATGKEPSVVNAGAATTTTGVTGFASNAQIVEAMSHPKYKTDPAYRAQVEARMGVTDLRSAGR
jgi:hypothetical protein